MTGSEVAQIITAIGFLITACTSAAGFFQSRSNGKQVAKIVEDVHTIEKATNSMKDQLVASTAKASLFEGTAIGLQQGRDEAREADAAEPVKVEIVKIPTIPKA